MIKNVILLFIDFHFDIKSNSNKLNKFNSLYLNRLNIVYNKKKLEM